MKHLWTVSSDIRMRGADKQPDGVLIRNRNARVSEFFYLLLFNQKIHANAHRLPCLQVIPRKADDGLLVRLDHPFDRQLRSTHHTWSSWFHVVPVGFRTYLQLIEGQIKAWTKQQEAVYQANRLSAELEQAMKVSQFLMFCFQ